MPLATPEVSSLTKKVDPSPTDDEVVIVKEVIAKKFGDMTLSDYNSEEDDDYSPSEAVTEDSLEWASETERTKAEDDLAEHKVRHRRAYACVSYCSFRLALITLALPSISPPRRLLPSRPCK